MSTRTLVAASALMLVLSLASVPDPRPETASANTLCAAQDTCATNLNSGILRIPTRTGHAWYYAEVPEGANVNDQDINATTLPQILQAAINAWTSLNVPRTTYIPEDYTNAGAVDSFYFLWVPQEALSPLHRDALAGTQHEFDYSQYPCAITGATVYFAQDPHDPIDRTQYYWSDCSGGCFNIYYDLQAAATHEFGHVLGLTDVNDPIQTMHFAIGPNDTNPRTLESCESDLIGQLYRDNYGPSMLDSFIVEPMSGSAVACKWSAMLEQGCRKYRITKQCRDGTTWVVADSVPCLGPGVPHLVLDTQLCPGPVTYTLALLDSVGPTTSRLEILAEAIHEPAGGAPMIAESAFHPGFAPQVLAAGSASPEDAVRGLATALSQGDMVERDRVLADGFMYVPLHGGFWGRTIDGLLEDASHACLEGIGLGQDSVTLIPISSTSAGPGLVEVRASIQYIRLPLRSLAEANLSGSSEFPCLYDPLQWNGEIVALVEQRNPWDGWRIRRVEEVR